MTLSDEIIDDDAILDGTIPAQYVKEFIKELKGLINKRHEDYFELYNGTPSILASIEIINKLAGDKLI